MDLLLVVNGNERFYCPPEQADYWVERGCAVFALTPKQIAGPPVVDAGGEVDEGASSEPAVTPVGDPVYATSTIGEN